MNELIEQLVARANQQLIEHLSVQANQHAESGQYTSVSHRQQIYDQKFAQLIVAECVIRIKEWRDASDEHMDAEPHWQGYRSGCDDAIVAIQTMIEDGAS